MGLFGKKIKMTYDEALNILLEGTASIETLEKAEDSLKYYYMRTCRFTLCYLSDCLGALYGLNESKSGGTAIDYVESIGVDLIAAHEHKLLEAATEGLMKIPGMHIFGTAAEKSGVISFLIDGIHHYDMGMLLDKLGIAVRTGHHCAQPLMTTLGIEGTVRASFGIYNTPAEVEAFIAAVDRVAKMFHHS